MDYDLIVNTTQLFFEKMNVEIEKLEITQEGDNIFYVKLKTNDSSLVIGYSGKNLDDIRTVLKGIISKLHGKNVKIQLEVNDYLSKKDDKLFDFIRKKIEIAKTGKEVILPYFNSYERKKIHGYVNELKDEEIFTKSIGEGEERRLHICKKSTHITIDIDGIDI